MIWCSSGRRVAFDQGLMVQKAENGVQSVAEATDIVDLCHEILSAASVAIINIDLASERVDVVGEEALADARLGIHRIVIVAKTIQGHVKTPDRLVPRTAKSES